jgi:L-rhamnose mutarotase
MASRYQQLHAEVWPEVLAALRAAHMTNVTIFLRDGLLFKYVEYTGDDFEADAARVAADPATQRWWALTSLCQQPLESVTEGQWWAAAEEVFHLD